MQRYDATSGTWVVEDQSSTELSSWQGFFVERSDPGGTEPGAASLTFDPAGRIATAPFVGSKSEETEPDVRRARLALGLTVTSAEGDTLSRDAAAQVLFDARATRGWDPWDVSKLTPLASEYALVAPEGTGRGDTLVSKAVESRS